MAKCSSIQVAAHWFYFSFCRMYTFQFDYIECNVWPRFLFVFGKLLSLPRLVQHFLLFIAKYFHLKKEKITKFVVIKDWNGFAINSSIRIKFWLNNNSWDFCLVHECFFFCVQCTNWKCCNLLNRQVKIMRKKMIKISFLILYLLYEGNNGGEWWMMNGWCCWVYAFFKT